MNAAPVSGNGPQPNRADRFSGSAPASTAVVLMAYGTPRAAEEIAPYYTDIRRGRPPAPEQLAELTARYQAIGGLSPLAERTEAQRVALQRALDERALGAFDVVLGLKHASPSIEAAVDAVAARGIRRIVALVLAPHFSALSVGQYLERVRRASAAHDITVIAIDRWHLEPALISFLAAAVTDALGSMPANTKVLFTAHSLPERVVAMGDPYPQELQATARAVAGAAGLPRWAGWSVAWQSAGRTPEPWLGPDILRVIDDLAASENASGVLVCPCGFVADHLEVLYDLDIEAAERAERQGLAFRRTPSVNDDPRVIGALADRVLAAAS